MESEHSGWIIEEVFHIQNASKDEFPSYVQEHEKEVDDLVEALKEDAGKDSTSVVGGDLPCSERTDGAACIHQQGKDSECSVEVNDNCHRHDCGVDSGAIVADDLDVVDSAGNHISDGHVQTPSDVDLPSLIQPADPLDGEDLYALDHIENNTCDMVREPADHVFSNNASEFTDLSAINLEASHSTGQAQDVSVSLNSPSRLDDILSLSVHNEMPSDMNLSSDISSLQTLSDLSTCGANGAEDQLPLTSFNTGQTGQGLSEICAFSEGSVTDHFSLENNIEIVPCSSSEVEAEIMQFSQLSTTSFVPEEDAHKESDLTVLAPALSSVAIKGEPQDTGYEQASAQSEQITHLGQSSIQHSKSSEVCDSNRSDIITTVNKDGKKKRVRIVVVKGEWRKPKTKNKNKNLANAVRQGTQRIAQDQPQQLCFTPRSLSGSSAVPTALFRNVHIKTEPVDTGYCDKQSTRDSQQPSITLTSNSNSSQQEADSELATTSQQTLSQTPATQTNISTGPSSDPSSLLSRRADEGKESSEQGPASMDSTSAPEAALELETTSEKMVKPRIQSCSVKLQRLPSDIVTAGMVDLKNDSQILQDAAAHSLTSTLRKRSLHGKRPWECRLCDKAYKTKSAMTQHYKIHSGVREHVCTICGADFAYKSVLTSHYRFVHLKEKPHECPVCGKCFSWSSHLTTHLNRHYEYKPSTCPICNKQFNNFYIKKHLDTHSNARPFQCAICKARYKSKRGLEEHKKVHSGLKPFKCDTCGQKFPYSNSLVVHMRTHTGERPFSCPKCPSTFTQSTHLRTHLKGVHKIKSFPARERRELVQRVFAKPPPAITKDRFQLVRHALSQVDVLEKQVVEMNRSRAAGTAAEEVRHVTSLNANPFQSKAKGFSIKAKSAEYSGKAVSRRGRKRRGRGRGHWLASKHTGNGESGLISCEEDAYSCNSESAIDETTVHGESECGSSKRARIQDQELEICNDTIEDGDSDDSSLEPVSRANRCIVKFKFGTGRGQRKKSLL